VRSRLTRGRDQLRQLMGIEENVSPDRAPARRLSPPSACLMRRNARYEWFIEQFRADLRSAAAKSSRSSYKRRTTQPERQVSIACFFPLCTS